jgi:hypothetical protein
MARVHSPSYGTSVPRGPSTFGTIFKRTSVRYRQLNQVTTAIVKYPPPRRQFNPEAYMLMMFLMYARAPRKAAPEVDGFYSLGEIGADREKQWTRLTPYSIARRAG